jgi:hypothetical protein
MTTPTTLPSAAPTASAADELKVLGQIMGRVAKLSTGGKIWLRDRLTAEIDGEL